MKTIDQARQFKEDFMQGNGKANHKDKLTRQVAGVGRKLSHEEITALYGDSRIVQNIIDIPAEDMTRNWFTLKMENEQLARDIMSKLADLNAKKAFKEMFTYDRLRGDGFISLGVTQATKFDLSDELQMDKLYSVDYLHAFSSMKVNEFLINDDVFDIKYGQLQHIRNATFEELEDIAHSLYLAGEISFTEASILTFDYDRATQNIKKIMNGLVPTSFNLYETAANKMGQRDWVAEFEAQVTKDLRYGNLIGHSNKMKILNILQQLEK